MSGQTTKSLRLAVLLAAISSVAMAADDASAAGPPSRSCPPPYNDESPLKMITRGVSCEAAEQIVLKVNALVISDKPLHPIADFRCQVSYGSGRPIQCRRGDQEIRSPIPNFP
jgi:hypothetical protein